MAAAGELAGVVVAREDNSLLMAPSEECLNLVPGEAERRRVLEVAARDVARWVGGKLAGQQDSLRSLAEDGSPVPLGPVAQRTLMETQFVTSVALLAFGFAAAIADFLAPLINLVVGRWLAGAVGMVVVPALVMWVGLGSGNQTGVRRRILLMGTVMGVGSGYALSSRGLTVRTPPLFLHFLVSGLGLGFMPGRATGLRASVLLGSVGLGTLANVGLRRVLLSGSEGAWHLWSLCIAVVAFFDAQAQLNALREGKYQGWWHSVVAVVCVAWAHHLLTLSLAIPLSSPCYVPPFNERHFISATKQILCQAFN